MNVFDSSCWIELIEGSDIGEKIQQIIDNPSDLLVPSIVIYEVYRKLDRVMGVEYAQSVLNLMKKGKVVYLDEDLSVYSAQIGNQYRLAMADSIIYATAQKYGAMLWTCDKHFKDLSSVRYFDKSSPI
jgi:predicted nucleic acid-binding protein